MKKNVIVLALAVLSWTTMLAQKPNATQTKPGTTKPGATQTKPDEKTLPVNPLGEHYARKYAIASRWNDLDVAKDALYDLIIEYPGSDSLIFALAFYYYDTQKFASSALICVDLLARTPKNTQVLELAGASFEAINAFDKALQNYETLYLISNNPGILYKMAFLQYELKRYPECLTNVDILLSKPEADSMKMLFNDAADKQKEYTMRVSLLNLKGIVSKDQSDNVNAKKYFEEALKIAPDFQPAKKNLAALK